MEQCRAKLLERRAQMRKRKLERHQLQQQQQIKPAEENRFMDTRDESLSNLPSDSNLGQDPEIKQNFQKEAEQILHEDSNKVEYTGIPGLDLISKADSNEFESHEQAEDAVEYIDLEDDRQKIEAACNQSNNLNRPDLAEISKGINSILGDPNIVSLLSNINKPMVQIEYNSQNLKQNLIPSLLDIDTRSIQPMKKTINNEIRGTQVNQQDDQFFKIRNNINLQEDLSNKHMESFAGHGDLFNQKKNNLNQHNERLNHQEDAFNLEVAHHKQHGDHFKQQAENLNLQRELLYQQRDNLKQSFSSKNNNVTRNISLNVATFHIGHNPLNRPNSNNELSKLSFSQGGDSDRPRQDESFYPDNSRKKINPFKTKKNIRNNSQQVDNDFNFNMNINSFSNSSNQNDNSDTIYFNNQQSDIDVTQEKNLNFLSKKNEGFSGNTRGYNGDFLVNSRKDAKVSGPQHQQQECSGAEIDYFLKPTQVINYNNKKLPRSEHDMFSKMKVIDYEHKSAKPQNFSVVADCYPMRTFDYGHGSSKQSSEEKKGDNSLKFKNTTGAKRSFNSTMVSTYLTI